MKTICLCVLLSLTALAGAEDPVKDFYASLSRFKAEQAAERQTLFAAVVAAHPNTAPDRFERSVVSRRDRCLADLGKLLGDRNAAAAASMILKQMGPGRKEALAAARQGNAAAVTRLLEPIRPLWNDPMSALGDKLAPLDAAIALVQEMDGYLAQYPADGHPEPISKAALLKDFAGRVRIACAPKGSAQIMAYNASLTYPSALEKEQLRILNEYRMLLGINPLEMDVRLYLAARDHSRDMRDHNFFSHDSPIKGKKSFGDRAKLAGYGAARAENIARGQKSSQQVHDGWFSSQGHHANMVSGHTQIGVAKPVSFGHKNLVVAACCHRVVHPRMCRS